MENVMDLSRLALHGDALNRLSQRLHESPNATRRGLERAVPLSVAGLADHASIESNAAALLRAFEGGNYPHVDARELSKVVDDPRATEQVAKSGSGFLNRIFGNRLGALIDAVAAQSGLSRASATTVLGLATPLVLDTVGKEARNRHLDARGLSRLLADQKRKLWDRQRSTAAESWRTTATGGGLIAGPFVAPYTPRVTQERPRVVPEQRPVMQEQRTVIRERPPVVHERRSKFGIGWLLFGIAALGAIGLVALAVRRAQPELAVRDVEPRAPEVAAPQAPPPPEVAAPEVKAPELTVPSPGTPDPEAMSAPELTAPGATPPDLEAPPLAVAPETQEPATEVPERETSEPPPTAAPEAESKAQRSESATTEKRRSDGPLYWILREDDTQPLSEYLAGDDPVPQRFLLDGVRFETGSSDISPNATLDATAEALRNSGAKVRIDGHADDQGTAADNQELSLARAEAVKSYLVSKGVPEGNITTRGLSENRPLKPNDTAHHRARNRRAELVVIER
jgi:outer membrane protein OmpA-like peptidoglycan-associated protein